MAASPRLALAMIRRLHKAEVHVHFGGLRRPETIWELSRDINLIKPLPGCYRFTTKQACFRDMCAREGCASLVEYLRAFRPSKAIYKRRPGVLERLTLEACEDLAKDGVVYAELRFTPAPNDERTGTTDFDDEVRRLSAALDEAEARFRAPDGAPVHFRLIVVVTRDQPPSLGIKVAKCCARAVESDLGRRLVAVDLAGAEDGNPPFHYAAAFRIAQCAGLGLTTHAGEVPSILENQDDPPIKRYGGSYIRDALRQGAQRIGHCAAIVKLGDDGHFLQDSQGNPVLDWELLRELVDLALPIEVCVTSNLRVKAVHKHPVRELFKAGAITCICTDNPTTIGTPGCPRTLSEELLLLHTEYGFTVGDIIKVIDYSFRAIFAEPETRMCLRERAFHQAIEVLIENGIDLRASQIDLRYFKKQRVISPDYAFPTEVSRQSSPMPYSYSSS